MLVEEWRQADKEVLIKDLIKTYINQLTFQTFCQIYYLLNKALSDEKPINHNDEI